MRSFSPLFRGEKVGMRGSVRERDSWREPLTRPASLRFAGRPLPAKERGEVSKPRFCPQHYSKI